MGKIFHLHRRPAKVQFKPRVSLHGDTYSYLVNESNQRRITPGDLISEMVESRYRELHGRLP